MISIVTVTRRNPSALAQTIESVSGARLTSYEHIVIEGDDSPSALPQVRSVPSRGDRRAWCVEPDGGPYEGMNRGLIAAVGDWVWFMNSGDAVPTDFDSTALENALTHAASSVAWVIGHARVVTPQMKMTELKSSAGYSLAKLNSGAYTPCHQAVLCRRSELARVGGFRTKFRLAADYDVFLGLAARSTPLLLSQVLVDYQQGGMSSNRPVILREYLAARRDRLDRPTLTSAMDVLHTEAALARHRARSLLRTSVQK